MDSLIWCEIVLLGWSDFSNGSDTLGKRAGISPFRELAKHGPMPLGTAVLTSAGRLPYKGIIHVTGINLLWRSSKRSIQESVRNALSLAKSNEFQSIALPIIGAGSGGFNEEKALRVILETLEEVEFPGVVRVVRFGGKN